MLITCYKQYFFFLIILFVIYFIYVQVCITKRNIDIHMIQSNGNNEEISLTILTTIQLFFVNGKTRMFCSYKLRNLLYRALKVNFLSRNVYDRFNQRIYTNKVKFETNKV